MADAEIVVGIRGEVGGGKVIERTLNDIDTAGKKATRSTKELQTQFAATAGAANLLRGAMVAAIAAFSLRQLQQIVDTYTNIQNRLKLVTGSSSELVGVTQELFSISNETRQSFEGTAEVYARMALATKELGLSQRETLDFSKSLNQAVALSGASSAEASAGLIQLSQGLASGALRGDELRSVLEQLPAVADVIAKGMGVTRGELRKMGEEGKISAEQVLNAFKSAREELNDKFAKTVPTIGQSFVVLKNRVIEFVGELDKATGASGLIAKAILLLGQGFDFLTKNIVVVTDKISTFSNELKAGITENITELIILIDKATTALSRLFGGSGQNFSGLSAKELRDAADKLVVDLSNKSNATTIKGTVSTTALPAAPKITVQTEDQKKAQKAIEKVTEALRFQNAQLFRTAEQQAIYNNLQQAGVSINSKAGQEIVNLTNQYEANSKMLERQKQIADSMASAFDGFFKTAIQGAEGWGGAIRGLIGNLADMAFQMLVVDKIKANLFGGSGGGGGIFGAIAGGLTSIFGGGGQSAFYRAQQRGLSNPNLYGPGFATGGSMVLGGDPGHDQNQLSLNGNPIARVGRGEILTISPNQQGGNGSGVNITQIFNISTGVAATVASEMASFLPRIQAATQTAINEAQMRGIKA